MPLAGVGLHAQVEMFTPYVQTWFGGHALTSERVAVAMIAFKNIFILYKSEIEVDEVFLNCNLSCCEYFTAFTSRSSAARER